MSQFRNFRNCMNRFNKDLRPSEKQPEVLFDVMEESLFCFVYPCLLHGFENTLAATRRIIVKFRQSHN